MEQEKQYLTIEEKYKFLSECQNLKRIRFFFSSEPSKFNDRTFSSYDELKKAEEISLPINIVGNDPDQLISRALSKLSNKNNLASIEIDAKNIPADKAPSGYFAKEFNNFPNLKNINISGNFSIYKRIGDLKTEGLYEEDKIAGTTYRVESVYNTRYESELLQQLEKLNPNIVLSLDIKNFNNSAHNDIRKKYQKLKEQKKILLENELNNGGNSR